jgi:plastocyanin
MERGPPSRVGIGERRHTTMKHRRIASWTGSVLAAGGLALWPSGGPVAAAPTPTITIDDFTYTPAAVTVARGTTVRWVNHDEEPHTVTSATGAFASAGLVKDDSFAQTFTTRGTYQYFCALHPHMKATVVVQ